MDYPTNVNTFDELYDDDVFYDELRRQVLQLTAEDDDDDVYDNKIAKTMEARKQGTLYHRPCNVPRPGCYYNWPGKKEDCDAPPAWILSLWRNGSGTGVFIPQAVQYGRRNKSRRKKNERGVTYRPVAKIN